MEEKRAVVSNLIQGASIRRLAAEIERCEVRCANCHRKKTAIEQDWYKTLVEDQELSSQTESMRS